MIGRDTARALAAVFAGGLVGSALRAGVGTWLPAQRGSFPTAVLVVNIAGSFLLGLYLARRERSVGPGWSLQFWAFGLLGSFTTFSAFSLDVFYLLEDGRPLSAAGYVTASIVGGLAAALIGQRAGRLG
ncbi:MAG TPA: CrcB family protein [Acidimicrobiia bacterium]|nr:CrcB family protein [Acidimicrobiia bacterium]